MTALARARRFERSGFLAIDPKAFLELFIAPEAAPANTEMGDAVVVDIRGPLDSRASSWADSYESIIGRVREACESSARGVVLRIDSPGGEAQGCFECAREIRATCAAAGKQLIAYVDGRACSAAYAIASAAQWIALSESATVGSIGVLSMRTDYSAMNASRGVRVAFIASGSRKADGHPDAPLTDAELAAEQQTVDSLAGVFFALVSEHRGSDPKAVAQLEARVLHGAQAVAAGLADEVATFGSVLARIAAGGMEQRTMAMTYEKMRAALEEMAGGEDQNAKAAKRALAALDGGGDEPDGDEKPAAEDPPAEGDADKSAEAPPDDKSAEDGKDKPAGMAAAGGGDPIALQALAEVHKLKAQLAERDARDERERLLATRNDFAPEMIAALRKAPLATVRDMVATLPKGAPVASVAQRTAADTTKRAPTRGATAGDANAARLPPEDKAALDRAMGLDTPKAGIIDTPYRLTLGGTAAVAPKGTQH